MDLERERSVIVDTDAYESPFRELNPVWSPDGQWLAYCKLLPSHLHAVFVYSVEDGKARQITDGMSDALSAAFDRGGKYLYFTASTDVGLSAAWVDMSSLNRPVTRSVYAVVLRKDLPSPLAPESDEETGRKERPGAEGAASGEGAAAGAQGAGRGKDKEAAGDGAGAPVSVRIDFEGIDQRILALPIPARNYVTLKAGKEGVVLLAEGAPVAQELADEPSPVTIHRFDLEKRKTDKLVEGAGHLSVSADGEKMLFRKGAAWFIAPTAEPPKPGEGELSLDGLEVFSDPRAEWAQMYREAWRIQRDFFYDPGHHGLDLESARRRYEPFLAGITSRDDLNYLFEEMLGELTVGHMYISGGDGPDVRKVAVGLLGADYRVERGRYRFATVYDGARSIR